VLVAFKKLNKTFRTESLRFCEFTTQHLARWWLGCTIDTETRLAAAGFLLNWITSEICGKAPEALRELFGLLAAAVVGAVVLMAHGGCLYLFGDEWL
jgi:hypothetical protein